MTSTRVLTCAALLLLGKLATASALAAAAPALAAAAAATAAPRAGLCDKACERMVLDAYALQGKGRYQEALAAFKAAERAYPTASLPVASGAALILALSDNAAGEQKGSMRGAARAMAQQALALQADDPIAQEVVRLIDDGPTPLRAPAPAAARPFTEAEALFAQGRYGDAVARYEAAMAADPAFSSAWVGAGNSHFFQRDWARAEPLFRRATEIEPRNAQAWRYLADTLAAQGKRDAAEQALYAAIGADPAQRPNWTKLAAASKARGVALESLGLRRGVRVEQRADGKFTLHLDMGAAQETTPDRALRLTLGTREMQLRDEAKAGARTPFEIELDAWRAALKVIDEAQAGGAEGLSDPALKRMQAFARDGQLEPALLLLQFRQAYRPELERWLAANQDGVRRFVERYGIRP